MNMDHYNTLGVDRTSSQDEIKKAYRKLAMMYHPDKGGDLAKFQEISVAYETLSDPDKRSAYDNPFPQYNRPNMGGFHFNMNGVDMSEIFAQAFGQTASSAFDQTFGRQGGFRQQSQQVYRARVTVSLSSSYHSEEQALHLGTPQGTKVVSIKVPLGVSSGDQVRYEGLIENAQLIIEFIVLPDLKFDRQGPNLHSNYPISVLDLIVGKKVEFTAFSGVKLEIDIPAGTQPNQQIRISGHGMPIGNGVYGDQILLLKPYTPANISEDVVESIKRSTLST
jgi:curved DNA-binding protein